MANTKSSGLHHEFATVDTAPGASGYFTNPVNIRQEKVQKIFFTMRGAGTVTPIIQFKCIGDTTWTTYNYSETLVAGDRLVIEGVGTGTQWRAGVLNDAAYTSGNITFGFDW